MARYADWYAVELDSYLKGRISDVQRFEAVREVTSHFAEHVEELVERGMDPIEAEKAAIKAFGTPRTAAVNLLNTGKSTLVGNILLLLGALGMITVIALIGMAYLAFFLKHQFGPVDRSYFISIFGSAIAMTVIGFIAGTILTKKVSTTLFVGSWLVGVGLVCVSFWAQRDVPFAQIPEKDFASTLELWKSEQGKSARIGAIVESVRKTWKPWYENDKEMEPKVADINKAIMVEAPKLLAMKSSMVFLDGKLTSGYLAPILKSDHWATFPNDKAFTVWFPRDQLHLAYFKTIEEASKQWKFDGLYEGYGSSMFTRMAFRQQEFIDEAVGISRMSTMGKFARSVGPFTGISFASTLGIILIACLLVKIPNFTVQSSFRRRLA